MNAEKIRQNVLMLCAEEVPSADCQIKMVEAGIQEGRREVVEFVEEIGFIGSKTRWQAQLKEWGIEPKEA